MSSETRQRKLFDFFERLPLRRHPPRAAPIVGAASGTVVALWDESKTALAPWAAAGYTCVYASPSAGADVHTSSPPPVFACAFPSVRTGARQRKQKHGSVHAAVDVFQSTEALFRAWGCPYFIEGPAFGLFPRLWRAPAFVYHPFFFGGYLDADDAHPDFPDIIPRQDAYRRASGLWTGGGYRHPSQRAVQPTWRYVYSPKQRKQRRVNPVLFARATDGRFARACPPRGFVRAVCLRLTRGKRI